jgi:hypothetical protein
MKVWLVTVQTFVGGTSEIVAQSYDIFATEKSAKKYAEKMHEQDAHWDTVAEYSEMEVQE